MPTRIDTEATDMIKKADYITCNPDTIILKQEDLSTLMA
jgi:hypothetical protein